MAGSRSGGVFDLEILDERAGQVIVRATGKRARETFADEAGGHRWQRVPPNEKRGRVQTSTVTVAVLPEPTPAEVRVDDRDLEWSRCRGSGAGGQNRNKTETAAIVVHKPSGLTVRCETERSLLQNQNNALALLRARLYERARKGLKDARDDERKRQLGSGMRGDKRRTIRCQDGSVVDHVTGRAWSFRDYARGDW